MGLPYRPEIDGLRALAVIPVILFHAGFDIFSGGYVGVDVFFVISGYLITCLIIAEIDQGKFSLINFYERRARRILPALFLVLAVSTAIAWVVLIRKSFMDFSQSLAAVPLFLSNILFWGESGYFDTASELKPLLHTWSLAIEEQFYVIFPLVLLALWKWARRALPVILLVMAFVSLAFAHIGAQANPAATFFLLHTRFWELLIGALCGMLYFRRQKMFDNSLLAGLGLAAILLSVFMFDARTPFPSLYALLPTLGTALIIIFAGPKSLVTRVLSLKMFVGVGLISYSLYLWHQPLLAFAKHATLHEPSLGVNFSLIILSIILAALTWRFVEQPFRGKKRFSTLQIFGMSALASLLFFCIGFYGAYLKPAEYPEQLASIYEDAYQDTDACVFYNGFNAGGVEDCLSRLPKMKKAFLIGDSHAHAMSASIREMLAKKNYDLITFAYDGCLPIRNTTRLPDKAWQGCNNFKANVLDIIDEQAGAPVIISTRWSHYIQGNTFDNTEGGIEPPLPGETFVTNGQGRLKKETPLIDHIISEIERLSKSHKVIALTQVPETGWHVPFRIHKSIRLRREINEITTPYAAYKARNKVANEALAQVTDENFGLVETHKLVCDSKLTERCLAYHEGQFYYRDDNHSSTLYSRMIAERIAQAL